ncbi:hypothetical protein EBR77_02480 [bacterium]|nr:hypothetical protein [bacterium]NBX78672.1 hypothetical protein [bacterium]
MQINITVLIQAFHFCIAYVMLRAFVFKPFVRVLEQQEHDKELLKQSVELEKQSYMVQKEEKRSIFIQLKNQLMTRMPVFGVQPPACEVKHVQHVDIQHELSQEEKEDIKKKALDILR